MIADFYKRLNIWISSSGSQDRILASPTSASRRPCALLHSDDVSVSMVKTVANRYNKCLNTAMQIYTSSVDNLKSLEHVMWYLMAKKHLYAFPRHKTSIGIDKAPRDGDIIVSCRAL